MTNMEKLERIVIQIGEGLVKVEDSLDALTKRQARTEASLDRLSKEQAETAAVVREMSRTVSETSRKVDEVSETVRKMAIDFNERYGHLGDRLGEITELVVVPGVRPVMNKLGHDFDQIFSNKIIKNSKGERKAEVDLFLDNRRCRKKIRIEKRSLCD